MVVVYTQEGKYPLEKSELNRAMIKEITGKQTRAKYMLRILFCIVL